MSTTGLLHHLSHEIQSFKVHDEHWFVHSSHLVAAPPRVPEKRPISASASGSATPSPSKERKRSPPRLQNWTIRLCQQHTTTLSTTKATNDDINNANSETESDEESSRDSANTSNAWYSTSFDAPKASLLTKKSGEVSWQTLELRIKVAWDKGCIDVMGAEEEREKDGTYSSIKLAFDSDEDEEGMSEKRRIEVHLDRLRGSSELTAASMVSTELIKAYTSLKSRTQSLVEERDAHRRLLQNNRRHERFREANSSLVNPGRLKRKTQDDEGFEGDDDDEENNDVGEEEK